jgi:hypothetical protein
MTLAFPFVTWAFLFVTSAFPFMTLAFRSVTLVFRFETFAFPFVTDAGVPISDFEALGQKATLVCSNAVLFSVIRAARFVSFGFVWPLCRATV